MPIIILETNIKAPIELVFNLSRSIELHQESTSSTNERAIAGKTSGLMELNDRVTWRAKHLGVYQNLSVVISEMIKYSYFKDEMIKGAFKRFSHQHFFEQKGKVTVMKDVFDYSSPLGVLGKLADALFLKNYMTRFLKERNRVIKLNAEK